MIVGWGWCLGVVGWGWVRVDGRRLFCWLCGMVWKHKHKHMTLPDLFWLIFFVNFFRIFLPSCCLPRSHCHSLSLPHSLTLILSLSPSFFLYFSLAGGARKGLLVWYESHGLLEMRPYMSHKRPKNKRPIVFCIWKYADNGVGACQLMYWAFRREGQVSVFLYSIMMLQPYVSSFQNGVIDRDGWWFMTGNVRGTFAKHHEMYRKSHS